MFKTKLFVPLNWRAREDSLLYICSKSFSFIGRYIYCNKGIVYLKFDNKIQLLYLYKAISGSSSVGRASASQAEGRGFEPRLPLFFNCV